MPNPTVKLPPALPLKLTQFHFCDLNPRILNSHLSTGGNIFWLRFELQQSLFTLKNKIERPDQIFTVIWPVEASPIENWIHLQITSNSQSSFVLTGNRTCRTTSTVLFSWGLGIGLRLLFHRSWDPGRRLRERTDISLRRDAMGWWWTNYGISWYGYMDLEMINQHIDVYIKSCRLIH